MNPRYLAVPTGTPSTAAVLDATDIVHVILNEDCLGNVDSCVTLMNDFTILLPCVFDIVVLLIGRDGSFRMFQCIDGDLLPQYPTVQDSSRASLPFKNNVPAVGCSSQIGSDSAVLKLNVNANDIT